MHWLVRIAGLALLAVVVLKVDWRDSVVLADGTTLRGEILGEAPAAWGETTTMRFRSADGAERTLARDEIRPDASASSPERDVREVNEGLVRIVDRGDRGTLLAGLLLFGLVTQIGVLRWWLLLRAQAVRISFSLARRLTFIGFFFNNVVPGPTGGDLVKAIYVARHTDRRAPAAVTVLVDRVAGILALALIAAAALCFRLEDPRFRELAQFIGLFLAGVCALAALFFSRRLRRALRLEGTSAKLPGGGIIKKVDEAILQWRAHKKDLFVALLLSFANQLCIQGLMVVFAKGLHVTTASGEELRFADYMVVLPVAFIVSALPMLPGGWGVREAAFIVCFGRLGVDRNPALALSILNGMTMLFWSLLGGVYFLLDRGAAPGGGPSARNGTETSRQGAGNVPGRA